ncbi:MAG: heme NO-binding domain-containing protein [Pseudomonadales bacterium]|nr:heme NO-binding domain-containing protein [Pseudomonadales bacterium]MDP4640876.1 heme NO-binding domain-containing protein [Pseudomonadales bacterium]
MKGIVMNLLAEMVEQQFGMAAWNQVLKAAELEGAYTSAALYADSELQTLVGLLSQQHQIPADDLVFAFGRFMFPAFVERYPLLLEKLPGFLPFLEAIDSVIHVEVRKIHPDATTPTFHHQRLSSTVLLLEYHSARQLCRLAEGLIDAVASYYGATYQLAHGPCLRHGGSHCGLLVTLTGATATEASA